MSFNQNDLTYTYTVNSDGTVNFTAHADNVEQKLGSIDLTSTDTIQAYLNQYVQDYIAGIVDVLNSVDIGDNVPVGQAQTVTPPSED